MGNITIGHRSGNGNPLNQYTFIIVVSKPGVRVWENGVGLIRFSELIIHSND